MLLSASGRGCVQVREKILGSTEIGIELENTQNVVLRLFVLAGGTEGTREIHADGAASGSALEGTLPEFHGLCEMALPGLNYSKIHLRIETIRIEFQCLLVTLDGV